MKRWGTGMGGKISFANISYMNKYVKFFCKVISKQEEHVAECTPACLSAASLHILSVVFCGWYVFLCF